MAEEIKRNPYTGMNMAVTNPGNGEVIKVEDLINKPQEDWKQFTPVDTLENADSEIANLNSELNESVSVETPSEVINVDDLMNMNSSKIEDNIESLRLKDDELINSLTGILNL